MLEITLRRRSCVRRRLCCLGILGQADPEECPKFQLGKSGRFQHSILRTGLRVFISISSVGCRDELRAWREILLFSKLEKGESVISGVPRLNTSKPGWPLVPRSLSPRDRGASEN